MIFYIFSLQFFRSVLNCSAYFKNGLFYPCLTLRNLFLSWHGSLNISPLPQCVTYFSLVWVTGKFCFASIIALKTNYTFAPFSRVLEFFFDAIMTKERWDSTFNELPEGSNKTQISNSFMTWKVVFLCRCYGNTVRTVKKITRKIKASFFFLLPTFFWSEGLNTLFIQ